RHRLPTASRHHAATVRLHRQHLACRADQRGGGVAPAAEGVVDVMQNHVRFSAANYHFISPLLTLAPISSAMPRPASGYRRCIAATSSAAFAALASSLS